MAYRVKMRMSTKINWRLAGVLAIIMLAVVAFGMSLRNGFVWDDAYYVVKNAGIRSWHNIAVFFYDPGRFMNGLDTQIWRPLRDISYTLDYAFWGLRPFGYHLTNLLLHILNAVLLYLLAARLLSSKVAAFFAAAFFAVHPAASEAVIWIKGRDDLLAMSFFLGALLVLSGEQGRRIWRNAAVLLLLLASLLAKEAAIGLLPTALLACLVIRREPDKKEGLCSWSLLVAGGVISIGYVLLRIVVVGRLSQTGWITGSMATTWMTMTRVMVDYFRLAVFPYPLLCDYHHITVIASPADPQLWVSLVFLALIVVLVLKLWRRMPVATLGLAWFYINLFSVSNIVPTMQLMAERFIYIPLAGICLVLGAVVSRTENMNRIVVGAVRVGLAVLLMLFIILSWNRCGDWRDDYSLFSADLSKAPQSEVLRQQAGVAAVARGDYAAAIKLLEPYVGSNSMSAVNCRSLGIAYSHAGRLKKGEALLKRAGELNPDWAQPCEDLGALSLKHGRPQEAVKWFKKAVDRDPCNSMRWSNLAMACRDSGREADFARALEKALEFNRGNIEALRAYAVLLWQRKEYDACAAVFQRILQLYPHDQDATYWLEEARQHIPAK